jgi:5-(hydroxymethyl)furfural/furfural oxidase
MTRRRWVVVGAGSAGSVVAARVSAFDGVDVELLEVGPDLRRGAVPPGIDGASFFDAMSEPGRLHDLTVRLAPGVPARRYPRGRGVGGSSAVNAMVALQGDPELYRSWGWTDVDEAWRHVVAPREAVADDELGPVDRALLAAAPDAERAVLTRRNGRRVTAAEAMLWPLADRRSLTVRPDTGAARVVLRGRRAIGVETLDGELIEADRVICCAGAIHTPALLLRSGVDTTGIGDGLQDHPSAPLTLILRDGATADPASLAIGSLLRRGDLQFLPMNHLGPDAPGLGLLMVALMRPVGPGGVVRLRDDDPRSEPDVDFALLGDERDAATLASGVRSALALLDGDPFRAIVDTVAVDAVGTPAAALADDAVLHRWVRGAVGDYVHASSTCAMGRVVDTDGAVVGYDGLYVCDASVFPTIPDVNTHLPTTMLAERLTARWAAGLDG